MCKFYHTGGYLQRLHFNIFMRHGTVYKHTSSTTDKAFQIMGIIYNKSKIVTIKPYQKFLELVVFINDLFLFVLNFIGQPGWLWVLFCFVFETDLTVLPWLARHLQCRPGWLELTVTHSPASVSLVHTLYMCMYVCVGVMLPVSALRVSHIVRIVYLW